MNNERQHIFDPLDKESFQRRCDSVVPSIYLTFISIIEGVALGLLAQQLFTFPPDSKDHFELLLARAPYAASTFVSMIIVTYEYIVLTLVHRYSYHLRDTVILFGLGFCQIIPIFFLHEPAWWWVGNALFCGAGVVAFINESLRNKESSFGLTGIYPMTQSKLRLDKRLSLLATALCIIAAWVLFSTHPPRMFPLIMLMFMFVVQFGILYRERKYIRLIHKQLGFFWDQ